ncbi:DUF2784 domain-containing protein [Ornithinimicrobium cavernae]|uniref:DUF2784 domain-containing protein n=1 Tax=Ornithinimicrobium cavernae TaxID=2666047 RepID=UPI00192A3415|nr:DUF2784 domain-containing protein [Ornithinimicrobium cavernae]
MTATRTPARSTALPYQAVAVGAGLAHLAFVVLVVLGGYLAWLQPWVLWLHLPALVWGMAGQVRPLPCPLTDLENWGRVRGGWARLPASGFIEYYLTGVVYPASWRSRMPFVVLAVVLPSWLGLVLR